MEIDSNEGDRAGHLAVESSAVEAETSVALIDWYFGHYLHVSALAASSHAVHNKDDGHILLVWGIFKLVDPVEGDVPSICEENLFALVLGNYVLGEEFIDGLYGVVEEERWWFVDIGRGRLVCFG